MDFQVEDFFYITQASTGSGGSANYDTVISPINTTQGLTLQVINGNLTLKNQLSNGKSLSRLNVMIIGTGTKKL